MFGGSIRQDKKNWLNPKPAGLSCLQMNESFSTFSWRHGRDRSRCFHGLYSDSSTKYLVMQTARFTYKGFKNFPIPSSNCDIISSVMVDQTAI